MRCARNCCAADRTPLGTSIIYTRARSRTTVIVIYKHYSNYYCYYYSRARAIIYCATECYVIVTTAVGRRDRGEEESRLYVLRSKTRRRRSRHRRRQSTMFTGRGELVSRVSKPAASRPRDYKTYNPARSDVMQQCIIAFLSGDAYKQ